MVGRFSEDGLTAVVIYVTNAGRTAGGPSEKASAAARTAAFCQKRFRRLAIEQISYARGGETGVADFGFCFLPGARARMPGRYTCNDNKTDRDTNGSSISLSHSVERQYNRNRRRGLPSLCEVSSIPPTVSRRFFTLDRAKKQGRRGDPLTDIEEG
jgi:hypothetical protein